jgi:hypothetical protein
MATISFLAVGTNKKTKKLSKTLKPLSPNPKVLTFIQT